MTNELNASDPNVNVDNFKFHYLEKFHLKLTIKK